MDKRLILIAHAARWEMEQFALRKDLHKYNRSDLECLCAISSWFFMNLAKYFKYPMHMVIGQYDWCGHCWNVYGSYHIDLTATQFDKHQRVYITRVGEDNNYKFECFYRNQSSLVNETLNDWPVCQVPFTYEDTLDEHMDSAIERLTQRAVA